MVLGSGCESRGGVVVALALLFVVLAPGTSHADIVTAGSRMGGGIGMAAEPCSDDTSPVFGGGFGARADVPLALLEANFFYVFAGGAGKSCGNHWLTIPVLLKLDPPGVPVNFGGGIEARLPLSIQVPDDTETEPLVWYVPVVVEFELDVDLATLSVELRYEHQLTNHFVGPKADDTRLHQLILFTGFFF